jgi:type IV secretion system protein VirB9
MRRRAALATLSGLSGLIACWPLAAADARLRSVPYAVDQVYPLRGHAGFQIDLEFDGDEHFVGLGSGDVEALSFESQDNHLFIKPKALNVHTNLTVLTNRRVYHFEYVVATARSESNPQGFLYALRFEYPPPRPPPHIGPMVTDADFVAQNRARNSDYWYCGEQSLRPTAAWDDGVQTHLRFKSRSELPAVFVRNDDGSESLINFSIEQQDMVIHRIARQYIVRRGALTGCIANRSFAGTGDALRSGTIVPAVDRVTRGRVDAP